MKKRFIGILLSVVMIVGILPLGAAPVFADGGCIHSDTDGNGYCDNCGAVKYYAWNEVSEALEENYYEGTPMVITSETSSMSEGWYIASGEISRGNINVSGNVNIILFDDCDLTVTGSIILAENSNLSIYVSDIATGYGKVTVNGTTTESIYGYGNDTLTMNGGHLFAYGGWNGENGKEGIRIQTVNIYYAEIGAVGGEASYYDPDFSNLYGYGGAGVDGNVNIVNGSIYARGGDGKTARSKHGSLFGGAGAGITGNVTVSGGYVNATSGYSSDGLVQYAGITGILTFNGGVASMMGGVGKAAVGKFVLGEGVTLYNGADDSVIVPQGSYDDTIKALTDYSSDRGTITVHSLGGEKAPVSYLAYNTSTHEYETKTITDYKTYIPGVSDWGDGWYVVDHSMMIKGFKSYTHSGNINIILCDGCSLDVNGQFACTNLNFYTQSLGSDMGSFVAQGITKDTIYEDGISASTTAVHGGNIKAIGGEHKHGISGSLTVYDGSVEAYGGTPDKYGYGGCGIADGNVEVYNGSVLAVGASNSAGINGEVTIKGGKVKAYGGCNGAGIGGYTNFGDGKTVVIEGGEVEAYGGDNGAGIGGGVDGNGGTVTISVGKVIAKGGVGAAGIGGGQGGNSGNITINGGNIDAKGGIGAAGIGGGMYGSGDIITINGGIINAEGGNEDYFYGGAGIGSGYYEAEYYYDYGEYIFEEYGTSGTITVNGGEIIARGGYNSAGIGGGQGCCIGSITFYGGTTHAYGGMLFEGYNADGVDWGWFDCENDDSYYVESRPVNNGSFEVIKGVVYSNDRLLPEKHFHTLVEIPACEPTCTEDGLAKTMYVCQGEDSCGRYFWDAQGTIGIIPGDYDDNILPAPGHDFQDITDNGDGTHTLVCARCHEVVTEKHTWTFYDSNYHVCEVCDTYEQHVDANKDGKCDACSATITEYCEYNESLKAFEVKGIAINSINVVTASTREMKHDEGEGWYVVTHNVSISSRITVVGHVNLILCNGVTFYANGGIGLYKDSSITIYAQTTDTSKMGQLYSVLTASTSLGGCAAIGGGFANSTKFKCGDITINGGIITVNGGAYAPGIGAGKGFPCGNITINGGIIKSNTIKRRNNTSAIGGSESASCGNITINGGTVTANVGYYGAAIGAGSGGSCGDITINGGNVTASGDTGVSDTAKPNAGIGTSSNASCGNITINGGTVKATATSTGGAGIGSCAGGVATGPLDEYRDDRTRCGDITINGGTVTAKGGYRAAGIGTGCINFCGAITINGGTVTATGGDLGPAIGAGQGSVLGTQTKTVDQEGKVSYPRTYADITITGGVVKAQGGRDATAIGTGYRGELGKIIITGGYIEAVAGDMDNAAAIGNCSGGEGSYGTVLNEINISGGYVRANSNWRTPIGRGNPDGLPSNVNVIIDESLTSVLENNWHYVGFNIIEETEPDCVNNGNLRAIENPLESKYYSDFSFVSGKLIGNADKLAKWLATPTAEGGGMKPAKGHSWKDMHDGTHKCSVCEAVENHYDNDFNGCCDSCNAYVGSKIVVSLGAKIKTETSSLRLGATYNGKLLERSEREAVKDMGTIFYPSHLLGDDILDLNNANAVRMSATAIEEFEEDKVFADYETFTFYVTIVGIPENGWNTKIAFRPFIILGDGTVEYGEVMERCYNDVAAVKLK